MLPLADNPIAVAAALDVLRWKMATWRTTRLRRLSRNSRCGADGADCTIGSPKLVRYHLNLLRIWMDAGLSAISPGGSPM